jgi:aminomethyltransferase
MKESSWQGAKVFISRLGYTGEDGFEISIIQDKAPALWDALLKNPDVEAIGLAARDSLRLEMGYPLYGHDLDEKTTPIEANIGWVMSKGHSEFVGAGPVLAQVNAAPKKRVGVKLTESGIAREGAKIFVGDQEVGVLSSGGYSPSLKVAIGQGYVKSEFARDGQKVDVEVRGKRIPGLIQGLSFMPASTKSSSLT